MNRKPTQYEKFCETIRLHPECDVAPVRPFREWIKGMKLQLKVNLPSLFLLSSQHDPFYIGSATERRDAEWFAYLWQQLGYTDLTHLRRIHYRLLDLDVKKPNHMQYENTPKDWLLLELASKYARALGLVPADAFEDARNPDPILPSWIDDEVVEIAHAVTPEAPEFSLPGIEICDGKLDFEDEPYVRGYDENDRQDRAVYIECWIEKSTQDDILAPLCEELGVGFQTAAGMQSISTSVHFLKRVAKLGKPGRILYISDFDSSGIAMPRGVARQIEFYRPIYAPGSQVSLTQLALTLEQVKKFRLPRIPIKDSDPRKAAFERENGAGATELDALEARKPGELARLVREAVAKYDDQTLPERLEDAEQEADAIVADAWQDRTEELQEELADIREAVVAVKRRYGRKVEALSKSLQRDLRPYQKRLERLELKFDAVINGFNVEVPERPGPDVEVNEDLYFDSRRSYLQQMMRYRQPKTDQKGRG
jgi:hypothetical protein